VGSRGILKEIEEVKSLIQNLLHVVRAVSTAKMEVRTCVGEAIRNGALVTWYKDVDVPFESTILIPFR
jgi:hypothetical protein